MLGYKLLIIDEPGFVPISKTGAELLFELISYCHQRGATLITSHLLFDEWTENFGSERLTGALLDRLTHHVNILEINGESYRLGQSKAPKTRRNPKSASSEFGPHEPKHPGNRQLNDKRGRPAAGARLYANYTNPNVATSCASV